MSKWIWFLALSISSMKAASDECSAPPLVQQLRPVTIESQRLVLPGSAKLQFGLGNNAITFAHLEDMLIVKYRDGAMLSHRLLDSSEMRFADNSELPLADFIRLVFDSKVSGATEADKAEANAHRTAVQFGCTGMKHYRLGNIDAYGYEQTRANGERYHALFLLDEKRVHFIDVTGSDELARQVISTLSKRN